MHIAILTNGVSWKFFADLDKPNVMDSHPFFEVDLMNLSDADLDELERFSKKGLNIGQLLENRHRAEAHPGHQNPAHQADDRPPTKAWSAG